MNERLKLIAVNSAMGNKEVVNQQGTTKILFDTLQLTAGVPITYFEGCNTRTMPETNLQTNKLQVQESMVVNRISLSQQDDVYGGTMNYNPIPSGLVGDFSIEVGNELVVKNLPLWMFNNANAVSGLNIGNLFNGTINLMNPFVIPPQVNFRLTVRSVVFGNENQDQLIRFALLGFGTQYKPQIGY